MSERVVIIGAGGFARETLDVFDAMYQDLDDYFEFVGFIDEFAEPGTAILHRGKVLGGFDWFSTNEAQGVKAVCAVGAPEVKRKLVNKAKALHVEFTNLIHPKTAITDHVAWGEGIIVCAGCVITNNIVIKDHVHLNLNSTVGHDAVLEDYITTAPGVHINGNNVIEEGAYLGTGANLSEKLVVGRWSRVGAGAAVMGHIPPNTTAVGCPAKVVKTREEGWYKV